MNIIVFADRLKDFMKTETISKRSLSKELEVSRTTIIGWCNGKCYPRYDTLIKLADFFKTSTDYLLGLVPECFDEVTSEFPPEQVPDIYKMRIKGILKSKGKSEYQLAKELKIEQSMISKWKKKPHLPAIESIVKIANVLGCSVDYLLGRG